MIKLTLGCIAGSMGNSYTGAKGEVEFDMTHFLYDKNIFRQIMKCCISLEREFHADHYF